MSEEETQYEIDAEVGDIKLSVSGPNANLTERLFDDKLDRLEEVEVEDHHHVEAGAGWLVAQASAESPEEAMAIWLDMWEQMLDDVGELSEREREQAGLTRQ